MPDPGSYMSPAAVLVMALVVLVTLGVWLAAVFRADRQPARPGGETTGHAADEGVGPHSRVGSAAESGKAPA